MRALRNKNFAVFWVGALIANSGSWFQNLAAPYVLYASTGSATWVGLAAAGQFVPVMLLSLYGGTLAEKSPGSVRLILVLTQSARGLTALALFAVWTAGVREPLVLLSVIIAAGCAQGLSMPAWQVFVFQLCRREDLVSAVRLNSIQFNLARSFGPAVGGVALAAWGPSWAFLLAFLAISCVVIALLFIRVAPQPRAAGQVRAGVLRQFGTAMSYIRTQPGIALSLLLVVGIGVLGMPVFQNVIVFSESVLPGNEFGLTLMNLGLGVGTIIAVPITGGLEHKIDSARLARWSLLLYGLALIAFALSPTVWVASAILVAVGAAFLASISVCNNSVQIIVADHMRGRVLAVNVMIYTGSVATGSYLQGFLADHIGERETVVAAGSGLVVIWLLALPARGRWSLHRLDDPHDVSEPGVPRQGRPPAVPAPQNTAPTAGPGTALPCEHN